MTELEAAWVRDHAWPPRNRRRGNYPPRPAVCSCTWGTCYNCASGHHHICVTGDGKAALDRYVTAVLGWDGWRVAEVIWLPRQKPCRLLCPCPHPASTPADAAPLPAAAPRRACRPQPVPAGQLGLFGEAVTR
ncbi:DUF6248 family natural product biosynthesis protein [Streptomyces sp. ALI-76-A]|uniref:DUF6248 family natural product biosynthesis protein n=1 Tax=Streptomyces sp. ALI-76-A TaxID=3025736 RepID=UPI00256EF3F5|nr:DUF6248 family natural product biosynthesis protein [Streptomyces sp. ALI-76-A]MDL5205086.1 DUF6248 family natural product biosynthesis protein [Streptomyces sp. ALI-76-A]